MLPIPIKNGNELPFIKYTDVLSNIFIYKKMMVIYPESYESGSIFEGLLPEDISIYTTMTFNAVERNLGTYYLGDSPSSDIHNLRTETLKQQYKLVKIRTSVYNTYNQGSHVIQYGELGINEENIFLYIGSNPINDNSTFIEEHNSLLFTPRSSKKLNAQKELLDIMTNHMHVDNSINLIGKLLFRSEKGIRVLSAVQKIGQPLVDDWACLKSMVQIFEMHCGSLSQHDMKHIRSITNICNVGISNEIMAKVSTEDYVGDYVNIDNIYTVLLGDKKPVSGGSGKVIVSEPNDHIFIFYSDHGGPGVLGMPTYLYLYADDFISVLKKKHAFNSYKKMVIYVESYESKSIFEGLLSEDISIYATTTSNAMERSWGT
ncbi:hypothetical protein IEQ34_019349 [Dendrobium chrysotoxum]|uniref:Uncharacterized protein n=1 Tax=Dendrobium chrysotoxum TaxID=161865 RepID=A0AAV7G7J0_DENCH|nr:hypothetical protein IEQ34_019349 [Dendrobium chrysotoxum]